MKKENIINSAVIRFENAGCIIWSSQDKRYYMLSSNVGEWLADSLFSKNRSMADSFCKMPEELRERLNEIGVNEEAQVISNQKRVSRPLYAPLEYYFDFTNRCNLHCSCCYNIKHLGQTTMENATIAKIISEMSHLGIMRLYLAGGEPTIDISALTTYVDTAFHYGITTSMVTNGTLLTEDLCRYLLSRELVDISVSIEGWDDYSHRLRRNDGLFDEAVSGLKTLIRLKQEMGATATEICVKPIIDRTQDKSFFENMIKFSIELKADKVKFANAERSLNHPGGYYGKNTTQYYDTIRTIAQLQQQYGNEIAITNVTNPCVGFGNIGIVGLHGCIGGQELMAIHADGRITPCSMNDTLLGNYYDFDSMEAFFDSSSSLSAYSQRIDNPSCHECKFYNMCRGGCQVRKIVQYGEIRGKDPLCPMCNHIPWTINSTGLENIITPIRVSHSL